MKKNEKNSLVKEVYGIIQVSLFLPLRPLLEDLTIPNPTSPLRYPTGNAGGDFVNPTSRNSGRKCRLLCRGGYGAGGDGGSRTEELVRHETRRWAVVGQGRGDAVPAQLQG